MESHNLNIKDIYFNSNISNFHATLDGGSDAQHTAIIVNGKV